MNYETELQSWGSTGSSYPDNYSYEEGEQPVDAWDNFFAYNVIEDIQHIINVTNNDLVQREGGSIASDLEISTHSLIGEFGSLGFSGTELTVDGALNVLQDIDVNGTVDGVDVAELHSSFQSHESDYENHTLDESAHHNRYEDSEAVNAVNAENVLSVDISGDSQTVDGHTPNDFWNKDEQVEPTSLVIPVDPNW